ncbi:MAG: IS66 family transposase, partial [Candidatus Methanofastidiosia archaeon]
IVASFDPELHPELSRPMRYIRNGIGDWFTCLDHPGMPATNNLAEQAIREHVVQRKIIGAFRSERGPGSYACIASLLETWSYQGKDPYEEMDMLLREELCLKD